MGLSTGQIVGYIGNDKGYSSMTGEEECNMALSDGVITQAEHTDCLGRVSGSGAQSSGNWMDRIDSVLSLANKIVPDKNNASTGSYTPPASTEATSNNTALFVGIGLVVAAGIGFAIYKSQD